MENEIRHYLHTIDLLANVDNKYRAMLRKLRLMEKQCDSILAALPTEKRDMLCDYLVLCESMSDRKLKIACEYMLLL